MLVVVHTGELPRRFGSGSGNGNGNGDVDDRRREIKPLGERRREKQVQKYVARARVRRVSYTRSRSMFRAMIELGKSVIQVCYRIHRFKPVLIVKRDNRK